jgi:hypothetical protein
MLVLVLPLSRLQLNVLLTTAACLPRMRATINSSIGTYLRLPLPVLITGISRIEDVQRTQRGR